MVGVCAVVVLFWDCVLSLCLNCSVVGDVRVSWYVLCLVLFCLLWLCCACVLLCVAGLWLCCSLRCGVLLCRVLWLFLCVVCGW